MRKLKDINTLFIQNLEHLYENEEILQLFRMTYSYITKNPSNRYSLDSNTEVTAVDHDQYINILEELCTGRPIQHILKQADFYGNVFSVNEHTLIPRPETEELVDWIIKEQIVEQKDPLSILDIGTGSGCIAISLKLKLKHAIVTALDISTEAIKVARKNISNLAPNIKIIEADILEWELSLGEKMDLDIIVSNPPYITTEEQSEMHNNVLLYEPHTALFVENHTPLLFYDAISEFGKHHLKPNGVLYFEINQYLACETRNLLLKKGYKNVEIRQDINSVDRMIKASF